MGRKQDFINFIENKVNFEGAPQNVLDYWDALKGKDDDKPLFTDNGKLILKYMQDHVADMPMGKAKDIGEGLFISSRTVSGGIRKLVTDGYVEKIGEDPVLYALTEKGKEINLD